jgi:hypothetical protein
LGDNTTLPNHTSIDKISSQIDEAKTELSKRLAKLEEVVIIPSSGRRFIYAYSIVLVALFTTVIGLWLGYIVLTYSTTQIPASNSTIASTEPQVHNSTRQTAKTTPADQRSLVIDESVRLSVFFVVVLTIIGFLMFFNQKKLWDQTKSNQLLTKLEGLNEAIEEIKSELNRLGKMP